MKNNRNKISQTEKELSDVQNKLYNLQMGINQPVKRNNTMNYHSNPKNYIDEKAITYSVKPPWATNFTIVLFIFFL